MRPTTSVAGRFSDVAFVLGVRTGGLDLDDGGERTLEDFQWLLREIEHGGGEGVICEASLVDGLNDQEVRALFDAERDVEYAELATELRTLSTDIERQGTEKPGEKPDVKSQLLRLRRRYAEVSRIDFFSATGRMTVEGLLSDIDVRLSAEDSQAQKENKMAGNPMDDLVGKTWVTRQGVHVDRIACAWLIRRFVDPQRTAQVCRGKGLRGSAGRDPVRHVQGRVHPRR